MRKSWIIAAALVFVVALSASAIAISTKNKVPISGKTTLKFDVQPVANENVDMGQAGTSLGDQSITSLLLLQRGERVGRLDAVCSLTNTDPFTQLCHAGLSIDSGQVELMGRISGGSQGGPTRIQLSVVGGTGAYRHSHGNATVDPTGSGLTLVLTP